MYLFNEYRGIILAKAISLISGGLDSILATKIVLEQGIKVIGLTFKLPFLPSDSSLDTAKQICKEFKIKCRIIDLTDSKSYYNMIKKPEFGYGKNLNPCIDCHLFMLKIAKKIMKEENADFIVTGDVLGERPMSQRKNILNIIDKKAHLKAKVLRPLSAKCLDETEAEKTALVERQKLLAIQGRSRKEQFRLAKFYKIGRYPTPGGGCLLTEQQFCKKVEDLIRYKGLNSASVSFLKVGRHFRLNKKLKLIVGRSEADNKNIEDLFQPPQILMKCKNVVGPSAILHGAATKKDILLAAQIIVSFTKAEGKVIVEYSKSRMSAGKYILVEAIDRNKREKMRI
jgi:hypothetical protein